MRTTPELDVAPSSLAISRVRFLSADAETSRILGARLIASANIGVDGAERHLNLARAQLAFAEVLHGNALTGAHVGDEVAPSDCSTRQARR